MARGLPRSASLRARRWDALVLGGALGGLAAAVKLGRAGLRVCVVEEEQAARPPSFLREPFFLPGLAGEGPLDAGLRELGLPPIERRDLVADPVAFQVLLPEARVDVGRPELLAVELVSWGLAKPDDAEALVAALVEVGGRAQQRLATPEWIRRGRLRGLARSAREPVPLEPLPAVLRSPGPARACSPRRSPEAPPSPGPRPASAPCSSGASSRSTASSARSPARSAWSSSGATRASPASAPTTSGSGGR